MHAHQNIHLHATDSIAISPVCDAVDISSADYGAYVMMHVRDPEVADRMALMWRRLASRMRKRRNPHQPDPVATSLDREQETVEAVTP